MFKKYRCNEYGAHAALLHFLNRGLTIVYNGKAFDPRTGSRTCSGKTFPRIPLILIHIEGKDIEAFPC